MQDFIPKDKNSHWVNRGEFSVSIIKLTANWLFLICRKRESHLSSRSFIKIVCFQVIPGCFCAILRLFKEIFMLISLIIYIILDRKCRPVPSRKEMINTSYYRVFIMSNSIIPSLFSGFPGHVRTSRQWIKLQRSELRIASPASPSCRPAFTALGNDDSQIVGQQRSCLTARPASIFLSATVTDPEE